MKEEIILRWIKKAEEDLKIAKHLLEAEELLTGGVCFHCQQAVEKYLKGYLTHLGIRVGKTHDLDKLMNLCIEHDKDFEDLDKDKISSLGFYAVEVRYPDEFYTPSIEEAKKSFEIASNVKDFVFKKLDIHNLNDLMKDEK